MAKVLDNLVTEGLSGKLGKRLVFRKGKGGMTILSTRPVFSPDRVFSHAQQAQQSAFRQAATYAKVAMHQPLYIDLTKGTPLNAYNLAIADWFGKPEVLEIDAGEWTGRSGQTIRIKAQDNVKVTNVRVNIHNGAGSIYEQGEALQSETDGMLWTYITTTNVPTPPALLDASAQDLPGNIGASAIQLS